MGSECFISVFTFPVSFCPFLYFLPIIIMAVLSLTPNGEVMRFEQIKHFVKKWKKADFQRTVSDKTFMEALARGLVAMGKNSAGLDKMEARPFFVELIRRNAGCFWRILTWKFVYRTCDQIFDKADTTNCGLLSVEQLMATARGAWLYMGGLAKQSEIKLMTYYSQHYGGGEFLYDITSVKQIPPHLLTEIKEKIKAMGIDGEVSIEKK